MKLRLLTGLVLVASLIAVGCDPDRGTTPVAEKVDSASATVTPDAEAAPIKTPPKAKPKDPELAKYDNFEVKFPETFDGDFNPDGMEVGSAIGQLAPEINGVDLDGNEFKLSDYRGKVVMLDFYGDW